jgi:thiamine-phosphate pyrophosphorylase
MGVAQAETATQLYAVVEAGEAALDRLTAALSAAEFASMLILPPAGGALDAATARPLVEAAQEKNVAALIADDAQLARTLRADGVHLSPTKKLADAYAEARSILGRVGIVGVDPGISRHDAMTLAEDGAIIWPSARRPISTTGPRRARGVTSSSPGGRRSSRRPASPSMSRRPRKPRR